VCKIKDFRIGEEVQLLLQKQFNELASDGAMENKTNDNNDAQKCIDCVKEEDDNSETTST